VIFVRPLVRVHTLPVVRPHQRLRHGLDAPHGQYAPAGGLWRLALDLATEARDDIDKLGISMTPDQKLAAAQVYATLAVAQELAGDIPATPGRNAQGAADVVTDQDRP
jgi:hypothetical protein